MATEVIMPALGMAQETGQLVRWLKAEGESVNQGDVIAEIQTDKATMELEARGSGVLAGFLAHGGDDVPVGKPIAYILAPGEAVPAATASAPSARVSTLTPTPPPSAPVIAPNNAGFSLAVNGNGSNGHGATVARVVEASPLAARMATEHGISLADVPAANGRIQKSDVQAYLDALASRPAAAPSAPAGSNGARLQAASPKARRIAGERGVDIARIAGSGPGGAVLTADVLAANLTPSPSPTERGEQVTMSPIWRIMAERTTKSWQDIPHFFLNRDVNASRMIAWRERLKGRQAGNVTYSDLLVKVVAETLKAHPRVNASWRNGGIGANPEINIGLAVATADGLVVPVIHNADQLSVQEISEARAEVVKRAQAGKQRPSDIMGATFTISNLGMFGVDSFNAIVAAPNAAILAVGRMVDRVVPLNGVPAIQPIMSLSLSCDHRVIDGARGAQFLGALAELIEEPLGLLS